MEQPTATGRKARRNYFDEAEKLVDRLLELYAQVGTATATKNAIIVEAEANFTEDTKDQTAEIPVVEELLTRLLRQHQRYFQRRGGKTLTFPGGVVRYRIAAPTLVLPKIHTAIIARLHRIRGGKKYLALKYTINKDALANASPYLLGMIAPLGAYVSKHSIITLRLKGSDQPITLSRVRYPRRRRTRQKTG